MKSHNERVVKSRNQREGKYIPGWCINPNYRQDKKTGVWKSTLRAGQYFDVQGVRNYYDGWTTIPGLSFARVLRKGV